MADSITALRTVSKVANQVNFVSGYYAPGDGGGGQYWCDIADTTSPDNGGTVIVASDGGRWKLITNGSVSVKQFGAKAVGTSSFDDRIACQSALNTGLAVYFPATANAYYLSDSISVAANQEVYGDGAKSRIKLKDGTINGIIGSGVNGVTIRDLAFSTATQANAAAQTAAVYVDACQNWTVERVSGTNLGYWGVVLANSSNCKVVSCRFDTWFGSVQDSADIAVYGNSSYNLIDGNFCYGTGADHGILMQDPYIPAAKPTGNVFTNNHVGEHKASGIILYVTKAYDTQTLVAGNHIRDILGTALSGASGHGIYVQSAGGTVVTGNQISNCCRSTTSFETQVVAAIGVSTGDTSTYPTGTITEVVVSNNHISAPRGPGIAVQTCSVPVLVEGNHIQSTGAVAGVRGEAIYSVNADGLQIKNNLIDHVNANYAAINVVASGKTLNGISVSGNWIKGAVYGIYFNPAAGGAFINTIIHGNTVSGLSNTALYVQGLTGAVVTNNTLTSTGSVFYLTACPKAKLTANRFLSSYGSYSIIFTGAASSNAGTVADESNTFDGIVENDAGTGSLISLYGTAAPAGAGLWAVGDRVIKSNSTVGQPKGWRCTVAGNPGTWTSEGNL